jgi:hypothetical protein
LAGIIGLVAALLVLGHHVLEPVVSAQFLVDAFAVSAILTGTLRLVGVFEVERRTGRWWTFGGLALGSVEIVLGAIVLYADQGNLRLVTAAVGAWGAGRRDAAAPGGHQDPPIPPGTLSPFPVPCRTRSSSRRRRRSHANTAAYRAVITVTADHPSRGDAWVMHRTARCGNVDGGEAEPHPCGGRASGEQRRGGAVQQARPAALSS